MLLYMRYWIYWSPIIDCGSEKHSSVVSIAILEPKTDNLTRSQIQIGNHSKVFCCEGDIPALARSTKKSEMGAKICLKKDQLEL